MQSLCQVRTGLRPRKIKEQLLFECVGTEEGLPKALRSTLALSSLGLKASLRKRVSEEK